MPGGGILALDPATRTGWAWASLDAITTWSFMAAAGLPFPPRPVADLAIKHGSVSFVGAAHANFWRWLNKKLDEYEPGVVAIERPFVGRHFGNVEVLFGLQAIARLACDLRGVAIVGTSPQAIKAHVTGTKKASKDMMVSWARARGFKAADHNAADALALLDWAVCAIRRRQVQAA